MLWEHEIIRQVALKRITDGFRKNQQHPLMTGPLWGHHLATIPGKRERKTKLMILVIFSTICLYL